MPELTLQPIKGKGQINWPLFLFFWGPSLIVMQDFHNAGLLTFRAVAEPQISSKSAKSHEIHKNTTKSREIR